MWQEHDINNTNIPKKQHKYVYCLYMFVWCISSLHLQITFTVVPAAHRPSLATWPTEKQPPILIETTKLALVRDGLPDKSFSGYI